MSSKIWSVARNSRPLRAVMSIVPKRHINRFYHLPKSVAANLIYGFPSRKLTVIGVTGTKGKTSVCHILHHLLTQSGKKTALISTIGAFINNRQIDTGLHVTNPDPFTLQSLIKRALASGCGYVILEVTSHGLEQYRNWGIDFSVAVYTQITSDHLDYHGGKFQYRLAKANLLEQSKAVVLNRSDPAFSYLKKLADRRGIPVTSYTAQDDIKSQNNEAALTAAKLLGVSREDALREVSSVPGVPGRMEVVMRNPFTLVIDFAHTPDSFERALKKLRTMVKGRARLVAVFGCAGERDPDRRKMGAVAAKLCDIFVITAEDPRSESVAGISQEIADWAVKSGALEVSLSAVPERRTGQTMFIKITDRQQAIDVAVNLARQGDVVGLFGKGHEKSMNEGGMEVPWSEHDALAQEKAGRKMGNEVIAVVLAGGVGRRFWPIQADKAELEFLGKPLIQYTIDALTAAGLKTIVLVTNPSNQRLMTSLKFNNAQVQQVVQRQAKGMGDALLTAGRLISGRSVLVVNASDVFTANLFDLVLEKAGKTGAQIVIPGLEQKAYFPGGYLMLKKGLVTKIVEKPRPEDRPSNYLNLVAHYFADSTKLVKSLRETSAMADDRYEQAVSRMLQSQAAVLVKYRGRFGYLKYPWDIQAMSQFFLTGIQRSHRGSGQIHKTAIIDGPVVIGKGVRVLENAVIKGPAYIGDGSVIGTQALVLESMIEKSCVVGYGCEVVRSYLGEGCWLHRNYIGDSVLEGNNYFGAGAVTANFRFDEGSISTLVRETRMDTGLQKLGAIVGKGARIGVNASLMPGVKIGTNAVVGPAVVLYSDVKDDGRVFVKRE